MIRHQFIYILPLQQAPTYQSLYPGVDNRYLAATDYFAAAGYRSLGTYYPEYAAHAALGNSYLDVSGMYELVKKISRLNGCISQVAVGYQG